MVKFGKKFFFKATYEKKAKRRLIIGSIIGAIILIILIILLISFINKKPKNKNKISNDILLRSKITTEVNSTLPDKTSYFEKLANTNLDKITINYPEEMGIEPNVDECPIESLENINNILDGTTEGSLDEYECIKYVPTKLGTFKVNINVNNKEYNTDLIVKDLTAPVITLKPIEITAEDSYDVKDFVESCKDNYDSECIINYYYNSYDENENGLDYSKITTEGSYTVKITASDASGNSSLPLETTLTVQPKAPNKYLVTFDSNGGTNINGEYIEEGLVVTKPKNPTRNGYTFKEWKLDGITYDFNTPITSDITLVAEWTKNQSTPSKPSTPGCQYGDKKYNTNKYILSVYADSNSKCATSKSQLNTLIEGPLTANFIAKDANRIIDSYKGQQIPFEYGREILGILNTSGNGLVGYQITVTIQQKVNGTYTELARYRLDTNGKRHFTLNTINLPE